MENKISIDLDLLKILLDQHAKRLVGKVMKRFELSENKEEIKKQTKEIIYEEMRDLNEFFTNGKMLIEFNRKEGENHGK